MIRKIIIALFVPLFVAGLPVAGFGASDTKDLPPPGSLEEAEKALNGVSREVLMKYSETKTPQSGNIQMQEKVYEIKLPNGESQSVLKIIPVVRTSSRSGKDQKEPVLFPKCDLMYLLGDYNGDGKIDDSDAGMLRGIIGKERRKPSPQERKFDADGDGVLDPKNDPQFVLERSKNFR